MKSDDQPPMAGCRRGMTLLMAVFGVLLSAVAHAELGVDLLVSSSATVAPARFVVMTNVSGDDPVIAYEWQGLDVWPACIGSDCEVELSLAGCRRVSVEVTGLSGDTESADTQLCISDGHGEPPQARLRTLGLGSELKVWGRSSLGDADLVATYLYVDGVPVDDTSTKLSMASGCHAVDWMVIDAAGRMGEDRRNLCLSTSGPQLMLGSMPSGFTSSSTQSLCTALDHPLGLPTEVVESDFVYVEGCGAPEPTPSVFRRLISVAEDSTGVRSIASLISVHVPPGPSTLPWLSQPQELNFERTYTLAIAGGQPPFTVESEIYSESGVSSLVAGRQVENRQARLWLPPRPLIAAGYRLRATIKDARGAGTIFDMPISVQQMGLDAGVRTDGGPGPSVASADSAACTGLGGEGAAPLLLPLVFAGLLGRRRK